jgi:hypothetical protein
VFTKYSKIEQINQLRGKETMADTGKRVFSNEAYELFCKNKVYPTNRRIRPPEESFFAALNTVDMKATPERQRTTEVFRRHVDNAKKIQ